MNGELIGGCDIIEEMSNNGSLLPLLTAAVPTTQVENDALTISEVVELVQQGIPDAKVLVEGEGCDLLITVVSSQFSDLALVKKQQLVMTTLKGPLASGKLHAVSVKAYTPDEWLDRLSVKAEGLLQIQH